MQRKRERKERGLSRFLVFDSARLRPMQLEMCPMSRFHDNGNAREVGMDHARDEATGLQHGVGTKLACEQSGRGLLTTDERERNSQRRTYV